MDKQTGTTRDLEMTVSEASFRRAGLNSIGTCNGITTLSLHMCSPKIDKGASMKLLCQELGRGLKVLNIHRDFFDDSVRGSLYRDIRKICPHAEIHFCHFKDNICIDTASMLALGEAATSLYIHDQKDIIENIGPIGHACPNLQQIRMYPEDLSLSASRALFSVPKPRLVEIYGLESRETNQAEAFTFFQGLPGNVSRLQRFEYMGPAQPVDVLSRFISANRDLKTVVLGISAPPETKCRCRPSKIPTSSNAVLDWGPNVAGFLKIQGLLELTCFCKYPSSKKCNEFADVCVPARFSNMSPRISVLLLAFANPIISRESF